jgi:pimeloyl-ACP methyl ester carboxylesterase
MTTGFVDIAGERLELLRIAPEGRARPLVFLHEGLGSVAAWRDFPRQLCERLQAPGLVYSRRGYGQSTPLSAARRPDYLHREARQVLPALLAALGIEAPMLVGHSDGGSIALLHAARPDTPDAPHATHAPAAIAVMAPHVLVEDVTIDGIRATREAWQAGGAEGRLQVALSRAHADPAGAFFGWNDAWLDPAFRDWNIEDELEAVRCPVLAIQGVDDEYATMMQLDRIARRVSGPCRLLKLAACGHAPQRDQPAAVMSAIEALYREIR